MYSKRKAVRKYNAGFLGRQQAAARRIEIKGIASDIFPKGVDVEDENFEDSFNLFKERTGLSTGAAKRKLSI